MTAITHISDLLADLATDLPGCSQADKLAELDKAAQRFCDRSRTWRTRVRVAGDCGAESVLLDDAIYGARVVDLGRVRVNDAENCGFGLRRKPRLALDVNGAQYIVFRHPPVYGSEYTLDVDLTLKPGPLALVPSWLLTDYGDAIAAGAIVRLKRHAGKPYTDYKGAELYDHDWVRGVARAAQDGAKRLAGVDASSVVPVESEWSVGEGTTLRTIAGDNPTYGDLVKAVRTLVEDLTRKGVV